MIRFLTSFVPCVYPPILPNGSISDTKITPNLVKIRGSRHPGRLACTPSGAGPVWRLFRCLANPPWASGCLRLFGVGWRLRSGPSALRSAATPPQTGSGTLQPTPGLPNTSRSCQTGPAPDSALPNGRDPYILQSLARFGVIFGVGAGSVWQDLRRFGKI